MYFLFENRKGYCAYYAGATLFMLRSLGIPSRIAVGFLTVDRSGGKNKGWYWYYADQAHACGCRCCFATKPPISTVFVIGVSVLHDGLRYNCAATVAGGAVRALTPKEKLPDLQRLLRRANRLPRRARRRLRRSTACPSAISSSASTSARSPPRSARISGAPTAPPSAAPIPAPSWSATSPPRRSGWGWCRPGAS